MATLTCTEDQIRFMRAQRQQLVTLGPDPLSVLQAVLGTQSQVLEPSLIAVALRCQQVPTKEALKTMLFDQHAMVRTWGPRETVYLYDPQDWRTIIAAKQMWSRAGRQGAMPGEAICDMTVDHARTLERNFTRPDLAAIVPDDYIDAIRDLATKSGYDPRNFGAGRLVFAMAKRGDCCHGPKQKRAQSYTLRSVGYPKLPWPDTDAKAANQALIVRYLQAFGPSSVHDIAHFFGARVTLVRDWLSDLDGLVPLDCQGKQLLLPEQDAAIVTQPVPDDDDGWPLRLLPMFDTFLMGHADKDLAVPNLQDRKQIWKSGARVAPTVVYRGQLIATYKQKVLKKSVTLTLTPLSGWDKRLVPDIQREAQRLAIHLDVPVAKVIIAEA